MPTFHFGNITWMRMRMFVVIIGKPYGNIQRFSRLTPICMWVQCFMPMLIQFLLWTLLFNHCIWTRINFKLLFFGWWDTQFERFCIQCATKWCDEMKASLSMSGILLTRFIPPLLPLLCVCVFQFPISCWSMTTVCVSESLQTGLTIDMNAYAKRAWFILTFVFQWNKHFHIVVGTNARNRIQPNFEFAH